MSRSRAEYLVELAYCDPATSTAGTLYYSTDGRTSGPAETPANTTYGARLLEPGDVRRSVFAVGDRSVRVSRTVGELTLLNSDGALDALAGYAFDGRDLTIKRGVVGAALSTFTTAYVSTMSDVAVTEREARVSIRDAKFNLETPLQTTKYDGDNDLPDGLEGVEGDLKGKPKPRLYGVAKNIPAPCVNTAKLIYQVSDGAIDSVEGVYDKGFSLAFAPTGWTAVTHGLGATINLRCAAASDGRIVVGGSDSGASPIGFIATSDDNGDTWTKRTTALDAQFKALNHGNGVYVAVGTNATGGIETSPDGAAWTPRNGPGAGGTLWANAYIERLARWVAVGDGGVILTSDDDGATWTARTSGVAVDLWGVCEGPGLVCVVGRSSTVLTSEDAETWIEQDNPAGTSDLTYVTNHRGRYIAVGTAGVIISSDDAEAWTLRDSGVSSSLSILGIASQAGYLVGVGATDVCTISRDGGLTWSNAAAALPWVNAIEVLAIENRFLAVGLNVIARSVVPTVFASEADLLDDTLAPPPGSFGYYLAGGLIRLGSPPAGLITVDATQGATGADRTAGQLFEAVLTDAGYTSADWNTADVTALDVADNSELGIWLGSETTVAQVIDRIAETVGAWWGVGADGKYRIVQLVVPSGTADATFTANDILHLERLPVARPSYSTILRYARNYVVQTSDVADGVTDARRAELAKEWREAANTDTDVQTAHLLAVQTVEDSLYSVAADAVAEATRRQTLRGVKRHRYEMEVQLTATTEAIDLGDVVEITHPRFALTAGVKMRVLAVDPQRGRDRLRLSLWL